MPNMGKLVVLELLGNLSDRGFEVTLEIGEEGDRASAKFFGKLPANSDLANSVRQHWEQEYRPLGIPHTFRAIQAKKIRHYGSIQSCQKSANKLRDRFLSWLNSEEFQHLDTRLRENLSREDSIRFLIRSKDTRLHKLPWQEWDFFQRYPYAEYSFSDTHVRHERLQESPTEKVRILVILGHDEGIDVERDRQLFDELPNADVTFLVKPKRQEISDRLWEQPWDIIFFAGHGSSEEDTGKIYINPEDSLDISELWHGLRKAVKQGLQVAIFNSCDGLALPQKLDDPSIPQMIVMRDMIPDQVAHQFLKYFLKSFSEGNSFYLATREARERLKGLEDELPCASWLPVIFQNPTETPPTWESLVNSSSTNDELVTEKDKEVTKEEFIRSQRQVLSKLVLASIFISGLVTGIRYMGWLQFYELRAYDQFMQLRPQENRDSRFLIVEQREQDLRNYGYPLPDRILANVIQKIDANGPAVIGLNLYRPESVEEPLASQFKDNERLIVPCKYKTKGQEIAPPPEISNQSNKVGFTNLLQDPPGYIRRYLLSRGTNDMYPNEECETKHAFGFKVGSQYLQHTTKDINIYQNAQNAKNNWIISYKNRRAIFRKLQNHNAGYNSIEDKGNQILLNYRQTNNIAHRISVTDILQGDFDPELIENKVVLIGSVAPSSSDDLNKATPLGKRPGIYIEAHAASQIISAVKDQRPTISWLPYWVDTLLMFAWSLVGGGLVWLLEGNGRKLLLSLSLSLIALYAMYFFGFLHGIWLPLLPSILAFAIAAIYFFFQSQKSHL